MKNNSSIIASKNNGVAFITPNSMAQILLKSVFTLQGYPVRYKITRSISDGYDYLKSIGYQGETYF